MNSVLISMRVEVPLYIASLYRFALKTSHYSLAACRAVRQIIVFISLPVREPAFFQTLFYCQNLLLNLKFMALSSEQIDRVKMIQLVEIIAK